MQERDDLLLLHVMQVVSRGRNESTALRPAWRSGCFTRQQFLRPGMEVPIGMAKLTAQCLHAWTVAA